MTQTLRSECAVVGAGLAGAATAYHLALRGLRDVVVLDQEDTPGFHSSGRNAGMIRQVVSGEHVAALTAKGARFVSEAREMWSRPGLLEETGSLLLVRDRQRLDADMELARRQGVEVEWWDRSRVEEHVPATRGGQFAGGAFTPTDGTVDPSTLLDGYLTAARGKGVRFLPSHRVTGIRVERGRIAGVRAASDEIQTPRVVNAAGAWASGVARLAGALDIQLTPYRRHLVHTGPYPYAHADWPFVWHLDHDVYFRPESGGLLLSPCDQVAVEPGEPPADPEALTLLAEKLELAFPLLVEAPIARSWCGLRTFASDNTFVIGADPGVQGFYWVAGLGGHGVTTSSAVGELAAELILSPPSDRANPFDPARFTAS